MSKYDLPEGYIEAVTNVVCFLMYLEKAMPGFLMGGRTIGEAIEGFSHMTGLSQLRMKQIAFGDNDAPLSESAGGRS